MGWGQKVRNVSARAGARSGESSELAFVPGSPAGKGGARPLQDTYAGCGG